MQRFLSNADLSSLVAALHEAGTRVLAPVAVNAERVEYKPITKFEEAALGVRLAELPIKQFFLPRTEVLLQYKQTTHGVEIGEVPTEAKPQVILGATPCDAAALEIVDKVMNWGDRDELWNGRRAATTIVSLACTLGDASCFCTAVDLAPDAKRGSDVMLTTVENGFLAEVLTDKGEKLLENLPVQQASEAQKSAAEAAMKAERAKVENNLERLGPEFSQWLSGQFDHPIWKTASLRCLGCGTCASVCPACHCFDLVDEHVNSLEGERRRNWDSCQTSLFTVHASGHNPRATQSARYRQRILHKFAIYPAKFNEILCTGCGRCARACPGGVVLSEIVGELKAQSKAATEMQ